MTEEREEADSYLYMYKVGFIDGTRAMMKADGIIKNLQDRRIWEYIKGDCQEAWDKRFMKETKKYIKKAERGKKKK